MNLIRNWEGLNEYQDEFNFKPSKGKSANGIDYEKNNLSLVWDLDKQDYRMVNCDTVSSVKPYRPRKKNNELYKLLKKIQTNK